VAKTQNTARLAQTYNMLTSLDLPKLKDGEHRDRRYLFFVVRNERKSRKWVFRYTWKGAQRKIDIGTFPKVSLAEARSAWEKYTTWMARRENPADMLENEIHKAAGETVTVDTYLHKLKNKKPKSDQEPRKAMRGLGRESEKPSAIGRS
jgi:Arm DNA-binding domain